MRVSLAAEGRSASSLPPIEETSSEVGILLGLGVDTERTFSCAAQGDIAECSPLLFFRAEAGASLRILPQVEVALTGTYGVSGERGLATHDLFKVAASFRYFMSRGAFQPSIAVFAGMALAGDAPVAPGEPEHQLAPLVGVELPIGARVDSVGVWLVPSFFAAPFPRQELGTTVARDHLLWWAGLGVRGAYYLPL